MLLSEKITELRKRNGLSQEEFGAEIGVSRQAVSKWEMAQTTPDLNKIMVVIIIFALWKLTPYKRFSEENVELGFGVRGVVEEYKKSFEHTFLLGIIFGVVSLLAAVIPMMLISTLDKENNAAIIISACIMMLIFAFGISCIVYVVMINQVYKRILKLK